MKKWILLLLGMALCFLTACPGKEPGPEKPTCSDGIMNQDETGIDCGGKCIECFDCFSAYCSYLSGGIFSEPTRETTWKCTLYNGEPFVPDMGDVTQVILSAIRYTFSNKGTLNFISTGVDRDGRWEFDNPLDPKMIHFNFPDTTYNFRNEIVSLNENELEILWYEDAVATFKPE